MTTSKLYTFAATFVLLGICIQLGACQDYSWVNQPGDIYNQPCIDQLNFTWTYTPASQVPLAIQWSKLNASGTYDAIATFGGSFKPEPAYAGRLVQIGNTAELGLQNPTTADNGTYRASVTDGGGKTITSEHVLVSSVTTVDTSGINATCGEDGKTVTCVGVKSLGSPAANITLSFGVSSVTNRETETTVSEVMTSRETVTCSISGPATLCLAADVMKSASVECGPPPPMSSEATTATPTSTATTPTSSTATTPSTARTTDAPEKIRIDIILGCVGGGVVIAIIIIIFCCCCPSCCHGCCPSCCHSCCPSCCCRESTRKRKDNDGEIRSVTGGENGHTKTTLAKQETQVVMNDYPTSQKTEGDDLEKRMGGVDSEDITITIPDGQSDGMKDDRVPKPDGRSEGGMHRL